MRRALPAAVSVGLSLALFGCDMDVRRSGAGPTPEVAGQPTPGAAPEITAFPTCKEQILGTLILDPKEQRRMIDGSEHMREKARQLLIRRRNPLPNLTSHAVHSEVDFAANRDQFLEAFIAAQRAIGVTASSAEIAIALDPELPSGSIRINSHFDSCLSTYTFAADSQGSYRKVGL